MPEGLDVEDFSKQLNEEVLFSHSFTFNKVFSAAPRASKDTDESYKQKTDAMVNIINKIKFPSQLVKAQAHGKELALYLRSSTNELQHIRLQFYKGSYFHYGPRSDINTYPMSEFTNLVFTTKGEFVENPMSLFIVDCRTCTNFLKLDVFDGWGVTWSHSGFCVLSEHTQRKAELLRYADSGEYKEKFKGMSLLSFTYNQHWSNGFGAYMTSEGLHRFFMDTQLPPTTMITELMEPQNRQYLLRFIDMALLLRKELQVLGGCSSEHDIKNGYQPSAFGPKQKQMRAEFRLSFLQVYRKVKCRKEPIISVCFKSNDNSMKAAYMLRRCIPKDLLPSTTTTQTELEQSSSFQVGSETWYLLDPNKGKLTPNKLGVGPWDWVLGIDITIMNKLGLIKEKGPKNTEPRKNSKKKNPNRKNGTALKHRKLNYQQTGKQENLY